MKACVEAVREAGIPDGALPQIHISGCPSSCGTHQTGMIGLRGASKKTQGAMQSAFLLYVNWKEEQGKECMGRELGQRSVKQRSRHFLWHSVKKWLQVVLNFVTWKEQNPEALEKVATPYLQE